MWELEISITTKDYTLTLLGIPNFAFQLFLISITIDHPSHALILIR